MLGKTRGTLAQLAVLFEPDQAELAAILTLGVGRAAGGAAELLEKCEEGMIKVLAGIEEQMAAREKELIESAMREALKEAGPAIELSQGDSSISSAN